MDSIKKAQEEVDVLIEEFGGYWPVLSMFASLAEEVGELARELNALEKIKIKKPTEPIKKIEEEMGDVLFSLICLANQYSVDLGDSLEIVLAKYRKRDKNRYTSADME